MRSKQIEYVPDPNKFDLVTHRRNGQGHLVHVNPYRAYIVEHNRYYERPVGSGNLWLENNQPAGRVEFDKDGKREFKFGAPHQEWTAPPSGAEKVAEELIATQAQLAAAKAELDAIRKDREAKQPVQQDSKPIPPKLSKRE